MIQAACLLDLDRRAKLIGPTLSMVLMRDQWTGYEIEEAIWEPEQALREDGLADEIEAFETVRSRRYQGRRTQITQFP